MKKIKKLLVVGLFPILAFTMSSCTDYQDEIDQLDVRVTNLENLVKQANNELGSLKKIVQAFESGDVITGFEETLDPPGYKICFANSDPIYIYHGVDGKMPKIFVKKDNDGNYYWYIIDENGNEKPVTDIDGNKVKANGTDGISPQVRIVDGFWEVSIDGGSTWQKTGNPAIGKDGKDGKDANAIVDVRTYWTENGGFVEFITESGSFIVPLKGNNN